jgi:hypothetical protein
MLELKHYAGIKPNAGITDMLALVELPEGSGSTG